MFGAASHQRPRKWKLASIALLSQDFKACVRYGCENGFGNAMGLFHILGALPRGCTLLVQPLKSALSNRRGNDSRQLEVVCHALHLSSTASPLSRFPLRELIVGGWLAVP
jgi:hypothetical protein